MLKGQSCQTEKFILSESFTEAGPIILKRNYFLIFGTFTAGKKVR